MDSVGRSAHSPVANGGGDPDPYANLAWMRATMPVAQIPSAEGRPTWFVTSYASARTLLADPRLSNDHSTATGSAAGQRDLLGSDPPRHTRLRQLVAAAFSPRAVQRLRPAVAEICESAVASFAGRGSADLMAEYALPVPVRVIHTVLGVPPDRYDDPATVMDLFYRAGFVDGPDSAAMAEVEARVRSIVEYKRTHPGDDVTTDLLGAVERGELSGTELHGMVYALLGAGHTTTVPFLGAALLRVLDRPELIGDLLVDPACPRAVVEEALRHDSAVQMSVYRYATTDFEIAGNRIGRGDRLVISLAAANRDPDRFDGPDTFVPGPDRPSHLAFGHGIHVCLGAHLARLEGEIALTTLFRRLPAARLAVATEQIAWAFGPMLRGPRELPVVYPQEA